MLWLLKWPCQAIVDPAGGNLERISIWVGYGNQPRSLIGIADVDGDGFGVGRMTVARRDYDLLVSPRLVQSGGPRERAVDWIQYGTWITNTLPRSQVVG